MVAHDEAAFDVMNGAQATFSRSRLPAGLCHGKAKGRKSRQDAGATRERARFKNKRDAAVRHGMARCSAQ
jgi:hypothetical protein